MTMKQGVVGLLALCAVATSMLTPPVYSQETEEHEPEAVALAAPRLFSLRMSNRLSEISEAKIYEDDATPRIYDIEAAIEDGTIQALSNSEQFWQQPRELHVYRAGLKKEIKVVYWKDGQYIRSALKELNRLCRDLHTGRAARMDKRVFDSLWFAQQVAKQAGNTGPIEITSGYRSPSTNKNLRESGVKAAKNSYHMQAKAVDFRIPDLEISLLGKLMIELNDGGVGTYRRESGGWIHIDTGDARHWRG